MQVSISILLGIVDDVHKVMGDRKELSSILKQDIKIDSKFTMASLIQHLKGYHYFLLVFREI
jgi:hypothetical protein